MSTRWWWCRDCDVKWYDATDVCWSCETAVTMQPKAPPVLTSQIGLGMLMP